MTAALATGCGLIIGLEDRELPGDDVDAAVADGNVADTATSQDTGADTGGEKDGGIDVVTDAASDVDAADACTCAVGCNPDGVCLDEIVGVGVGAKHACILRADGKAFCSGDNEFFQLATNSVAASESWIAVSVTSGGVAVPLREIAVGPSSNCAIARSGDLYCWGKNSFSNISPAAVVVVSTPTKVDLGGLGVKAVSVGHQATCAIVDVAGTAPNVRCWGHSSSGDLGLGVDTTDGGDAGPYVQSAPQTVPGLRAKAIHVLAGDDEGLGRACAIREDDVPVCWGGTPNEEITSPAPSTTCDPTGAGAFACALGPTPWAAAAARDIGNGRDDVCAIETAPDASAEAGADASANRLRCRGTAGLFALDDQCAAPSAGFEVHVGDAGRRPVRLASGFFARCLVDDQSDVWCFGSNGTLQSTREGSDGCVDAGTTPPDRRPSEPLRATFFPDGGGSGAGEGAAIKATLLAVGLHGVLVYTTDKKLVAWGANQSGELGARPGSAADTASCFGVDGRCQGPTVIPPPAFP